MALIKRHLELLLGHGVVDPGVKIGTVCWCSVVLWDLGSFERWRHGCELSDALAVFGI